MCAREKITDESTVNICLRVLKETNKSRFDSYYLHNVPLFGNVRVFKEHILQRYREEIRPATDTNFGFGYCDGNKKFAIISEVQLAEALSLVKKGVMTLWVDPHLSTSVSVAGKKRKGTLSSAEAPVSKH